MGKKKKRLEFGIKLLLVGAVIAMGIGASLAIMNAFNNIGISPSENALCITVLPIFLMSAWVMNQIIKA